MYLKGEEEESLSNKYPEISDQWHPTKNLSIKPNMVRAYSDKKIWWQCKKGHEWVATIGNRVIGSGCPYCSGRRVCDDNSLQTLHPKIAKEWHPTKNGDLLPSGVTVSSSKKVWWQCKKEHEWQAAIYSRINGNGCPFCSGRYASADNCLQKSNPKLAKEWHPIKNGDLAPNDVTANSGKKVWWKCKKGHEWVATIGNRASGRGCPFCSGRYASTDNCLRILNPKLAKEWHPIKNGELIPSDVTPSSGKKVWWKCKKGHEWEAVISSRTSGRGCPFCSGRYASADNCLRILNPKLAKEWHPIKNGELTPSDVTPSSGKKVWWKCKKGHEWEARVADRNSGTGCPYCSGKRI